MKKFRAILLVGAIPVCFAFVAALASPSAGVDIAEKITSSINSFFSSNTVVTPVEYGSDAISNVNSFHWLDPIAPNSGDPSKFDPSLLNALTVDVCQVNGSNCTLFKTFTAQGSSSEQLRIISNGSTSYYIANWDTSKVKLNDKTYRVTVTLAGLQLGSIDLAPSVYNRFGRTWPIKFLIEKDPVLRVRYLHSLGRTAAQVVNVLRSEFSICGDQAKALLAGDLQPYPASDIDLAVQGVCQNVIIPSTTKISDDDTRNSLMTYDPSTGVMFFAIETQVLRNLSVGDVLVSEPSAAAPYGLLRKITSIRKNRGQYTLGTDQAKLNQAISQGTLIANGQLLPEQIASSTSGLYYAGSAESGDSEQQAEALDVGDNFNFHRDIDVTFDFAAADGGVTGTGNVHVVGSMDFNAGYDLGMGVETCAEIPPVCVDRVEAHVDVNQKSNIRVTGQFDGTIHKEKTIDTIQFSPITFFIGPIPVVIVPTIDVLVGVDGEAHANFVFAANAQSTLKVGAKWTDPGDGGAGWENIHEFNPLSGGVTESTLNANLTVDGYGKANAKLLLYDVAGPGMAARVGLLGHVQLGQKPLWTLSGHIVGDVNFSVDIASVIDLGNYSQRVLDESFQIGQAANQSPQCVKYTDPVQFEIGVAKTIGPLLGGIEGSFDCTDPEGDAVSYTAVSSNLNDGSNGVIPLRYAFQSGGLRTVTITARDLDGGTTIFTIGVDVHNSLPIVTISPSGGTVGATVQFFVSASAFDPDTNTFLTCDRLNWQVSSPDTLTVTGSGGTCSAVVKFNQQGTRTVTVTATDIYGGVGSNSISVNVTAAPTNQPPEINSFHVYAYRGPFQFPCEDPNYLCLLPANYTIYNGFPSGFVPPQIGEYYPPLYLDVSATDPDGTTPTVTWSCTTGATPGNITWDDFYGYLKCDPVPSNEFPVVIKVVVSDGVTPVERQQINWMFVGPR
jgi:hypothetical protein